MREYFVTSCHWTAYLRGTNLETVNPLFWKGKIILDIGSGIKEMDKPQNAFPGATVFALDPEFGGEINANNAHARIKGVAGALPLIDNSFDLVLSYYSFPMYFGAKEIPPVVCELLSVMKPSGEIRLFPVNPHSNGETFETLKMFIKKLKENGFVIGSRKQDYSYPSQLLIIKASENLQSDEAKNRAIKKLQ